jgi:hypothetical protein
VFGEKGVDDENHGHDDRQDNADDPHGRSAEMQPVIILADKKAVGEKGQRKGKKHKKLGFFKHIDTSRWCFSWKNDFADFSQSGCARAVNNIPVRRPLIAITILRLAP